MFKKSDKGYYFWEEFTEVDGIAHGFSTRKFGDMNWKNLKSIKNLKLFCDALQIEPTQTIQMEQVHGNNVKVVDYRTPLFRHSGKPVGRQAHPESEILKQVQNDKRDSGQGRMTWIDNTDGLISSPRGVFLVGTFADCIPILFLDKRKKIFGIAHVGWRGVYKEIVKCMISKMIDSGSSSQNILVGLGPSIRVCCYNIDKDRAQLFVKKFTKWQKKILQKKDNLTFLDLQTIIKIQLNESGILEKNIKDCMVCTKDNMSDFYSYRGEYGKTSFGLSAAVIGRI